MCAAFNKTFKKPKEHLDGAPIHSFSKTCRNLFRRGSRSFGIKSKDVRGLQGDPHEEIKRSIDSNSLADSEKTVSPLEAPKAPGFKASEGHRDSLYNLLQSIGGLCPIPVIGPCITLIKEIDMSFRRVKVQMIQCQDLLGLACSMVDYLRRTLESAEERSGKRMQKYKSASSDPEEEGEMHLSARELGAYKLVSEVQAFLNDLKEYSAVLNGYKDLKRIFHEEEIKKKIEGFKDRLKRIVEEYEITCFVNFDVWLRDFEQSQLEDIKRHEELMGGIKELGTQIGNVGERIGAMSATTRRIELIHQDDHTKEVVCYDSHEKYVEDVLPKVLGDCASESPPDLLFPVKIRFAEQLCGEKSIDGPEFRISKPQIRSAFENDCGPSFCVKTYRDVDQGYLHNLIKEIRHSKIMNHPNIVRFYGICTYANAENELSLNLVSEFCENQSIENFLKSVKGNADILYMLYEIAQAVEYLHSGNSGFKVIHGDIRPSKILVTKDRHAKLTSFRRSVVLENAEQMAMIQQSHQPDHERWRAPETFKEESVLGDFGNYESKSDVYGWAVTAGFLYCTNWNPSDPHDFKAFPPFADASNASIRSNVRGGDPFVDGRNYKRYGVLKLSEKIKNKELLDLLKECWNKDPEKRPTIFEVVEKVKQIGGYKDLRDTLEEERALMESRYLLTTPLETPPNERSSIELDVMD